MRLAAYLIVLAYPLEMANIRALDASSVHKLCSSQVVITLAIAIKELIENSVDAGSTKIGMMCFPTLNYEF